jgi:hypothetical protein
VRVVLELAQLSLLYLAPGALLLLLLVCGRYPGERRLSSRIRAVRARLRAPRRLAGARLRAPARSGLGGGALLARNLAGRGPPGAGRAATTLRAARTPISIS